MNAAWMAGLFEGEGCITGQMTKGDYYAPRLALKMTDFDVVKKFASMADCGHLYLEKRQKPHYKPAIRWSCTKSRDVYRILETMLPYFGERRSFKALNLLDTIDKC